MSRRLLWALIPAGALALAGLAGAGAMAAEPTAKSRSEAEEMAGEYIQLETVWMPVMTDGKAAYQGVVVRLWPRDDARYDACVKAPWVAEALLIHFNDTPIDRATFEDEKALDKIVDEVVAGATQKKIYRKVEIFTQFVIPDEASAILSNSCK